MFIGAISIPCQENRRGKLKPGKDGIHPSISELNIEKTH